MGGNVRTDAAIFGAPLAWAGFPPAVCCVPEVGQRDERYPSAERPGAAARRAPLILSPRELLVEPPIDDKAWAASCVRRIMLAATGGVAVARGLDPLSRTRLEEAGWPVVADLDPTSVHDARASAWPLLPRLASPDDLGAGCGSPAPWLVVVGEKTNRPGQVPFASKSGGWLLRALRHLGYDELAVHMTNAHTWTGALDDRLPRLWEALEPHEPRWLVLGEKARAAWQLRFKLPGRNVAFAPHPAAHYRWRHTDGTQGYAKRLLLSGLGLAPRVTPAEAARVAAAIAAVGERVPTTGKIEAREAAAGALLAAIELPAAALAAFPADVLPDLPEPYAVNCVTARTPEVRWRADPREGVTDPAAFARAKTLYLTGRVATPGEAAVEAGLSRNLVERTARSEGWEAARVETLRKVESEARSRILEQEVQKLMEARELAADVALLALRDGKIRLQAAAGDPAALDFLARLRDEEGDTTAVPLHPTPGQIRELQQTLLGFMQANVSADDPERERLADMDPHALYGEARELFLRLMPKARQDDDPPEPPARKEQVA